MVGLIGTVLTEPSGKKGWLVPSQGKFTSVCIDAGRAAQGLVSLYHTLGVWVFTEVLFCTDRNTALVNSGYNKGSSERSIIYI